MNLTTQFPRSPLEQYSGLVHVPRMIDKARARNAGTLGEYIYPCPLDKMVLEFLSVSSEDFLQKAVKETEETIKTWVSEKCGSLSEESLIDFNRKFQSRQPQDEEGWQKFNRLRDQIDPSRKDITTWVQLIDLEEGRL